MTLPICVRDAASSSSQHETNGGQPLPKLDSEQRPCACELEAALFSSCGCPAHCFADCSVASKAASSSATASSSTSVT